MSSREPRLNGGPPHRAARGPSAAVLAAVGLVGVAGAGGVLLLEGLVLRGASIPCSPDPSGACHGGVPARVVVVLALGILLASARVCMVADRRLREQARRAPRPPFRPPPLSRRPAAGRVQDRADRGES